jgi:hypothetical protein
MEEWEAVFGVTHDRTIKSRGSVLIATPSPRSELTVTGFGGLLQNFVKCQVKCYYYTSHRRRHARLLLLLLLLPL